ncbi:hypothetical protein [Citricoccus sp. NR2]|uniref:hypothetical protein n=1 Tax=Citricoccus sp. NR2 TaxID=3004095 RepID=UPI0022DD3250|nr:hypothetical protein [Citricoccus sp. NR2]WBL18622.1 hypothetical protein O1A05_12805 [Citricoccus sp. NR2]
MKAFSGVIAILLGLGAIFAALGLQTVWAPPEQVTAGVATEGEGAPGEAPLTIITGGITEVDDENIEYSLTGEGDYTLMLGQTRDIEAWVGDAAHNTITGVNTDVPRGESPVVTVEHTEGESTVPSPVSSDLWVDIQEAEGTITQRWSTPAEGEWALLVVADGTESAPTDFSVTWVNQEGNSPWIVPLYVIGSLLVLLGVLVLVWLAVVFQRKRKRPSGRRVAGRDAVGPATATTAVAAPAPAANDVEPHVEPEPTDEKASDESDETVEPDDTTDIDDDVDGGEAVDEPEQEQNGKDRPESPFLKRVVAGLGTVGLSAGLLWGGVGPATADTAEDASEPAASTDSDISEAPDAGSDAEEAGSDEYPVVVEQQLEQILTRVGATVARGDEEQDADVLSSRMMSQALQARKDNYRNRAIDDETRAVAALPAEPVLAAWSDASEEFPRNLVAVVGGEDDQIPQLVLLRQEDARSQYKVAYTAAMIQGTEFPVSSVMDSGIEQINVTDDTGLAMSPQAALQGLGDYLSDPDDDFGDQVGENVTIDALHTFQTERQESLEEATAEYSRTPVQNGYTSVRMPDGSALVIGSLNAETRMSPNEEGAGIEVSELSAELAGEDSRNHEGEVVEIYRESVAVLVPSAEDEDAQVRLVAMSDDIASVEYID